MIRLYSLRSFRPLPLSFVRNIRGIQHKSNFKTTDSTLESDEIVSDNNPWSPTLYEDLVYVRKPGSIRSTPLPSKYRLSYLALYEAPSSKYVAMLKRITLSFGVLGIYAAKLFYESSQFDDIYALGTLVSCATPAVIMQYKTKDYVTRIFRLYDKEQPQTLENLVNNEQLIVEKLNPTGGKTYNTLLQISNNKLLTLDQNDSIFAPYSTWKEIDPETNTKRKFYVADNIGGMKMDRIWGIIEKNSGVNNGRYYDEEKL